VIEEGIGELLAPPRPAAGDLVQLGGQHDVAQPLAGADVDTAVLEGLAQLETRPRSIVERLGHQGPRALHEGGRDLEPAVVGRHPLAYPGGRELEQPAQVVRTNEVPRRPQHVGAQDLARGEGAFHVGGGAVSQAEADAPHRARVVLRLDGQQVLDHLRRVAEGGSGDVLAAQAAEGDRARSHRGSLAALGRE
jgi:hypothetical protein